MELQMEINVRKTTASQLSSVDFDQLEFGKYTADHMLVMDYAQGEWGIPQIIPFGNFAVSPTILGLHYGQTVFEGMKAFRMQDGRINIFRMDKHYDRFTKSLERMCMPVLPKDIFMEGLVQLVSVDQDWVPTQEGASLYIRPFMFASEAKFGVKVSEEYRFVIFSGPVPSLFSQPLKLKVETDFVRAARGGTGYAKCGGNYGGAFYPTQQARLQGFDQVLWTDGGDDPAIEESGMMNALFVIDNTIVTAPLSDSILDGVTRSSLLVLAKEMGYRIEERSLYVSELQQAFRTNSIQEAFGAGTAAVVAPIGLIHINGIDHHLPVYTKDSLLNRLKDRLDQIRLGKEEDTHGWNHII